MPETQADDLGSRRPATERCDIDDPSPLSRPPDDLKMSSVGKAPRMQKPTAADPYRKQSSGLPASTCRHQGQVVMVRMSNALISPQRKPASDGAVCDARPVLVGISTGVAVGRRLQVKDNASVEWWSLFTTLEQIDACLASGPLRFEDPVLFAQVKREFEHVFNHAAARGFDQNQSPSS